jgi:two-component system, response regulator
VSEKVSFNILMADDDPDDCLLFAEAIDEIGLLHQVRTVHDGEALLDYLLASVKYQSDPNTVRPDLILLDLNMPKKDGREAIRQIKEDHQLRRIPIVVLTTSVSGADIVRVYEEGASSFLSKPTSFDGWVDLVRQLDKYWFHLVHLPSWIE